MDVVTYNLLSPLTMFRFVRDVSNVGSPQALKNLVGERDYPDALAFRFLGIKNFHYIINPHWFTDIFNQVDIFQKPPSVINYVSLHGRQGIFTAGYEEWKKQRAVLKPHFGKAALTGHEGAVQKETQALVDHWQKAGGTKDVYEDLRNFSLRILFQTVFKYDTQEHFDELKRSIDVLNGFLFKNLLNPLTFLFQCYFSAPAEVQKAKDCLDMIVNNVCRPYEGGYQEGVLVSEIMNACGYYIAKTDALKAEAKKDVGDQVWQLISAGYEATASIMTWAVAELANWPEQQEKLRAEIAEKLGDAPLTLRDVQKLTEMNKYLAEITRLHPTLHTTVPRKAFADAVIGGGYKIDKGDIVVVPLINVQTDPRWFPEPMRLDPDRKRIGADGRETPAHAQMPFLMGGHACVGKPMFMQQSTSAITEILRRGAISLTDGLPSVVYKTTILPGNDCGLVFKPGT